MAPVTNYLCHKMQQRVLCIVIYADLCHSGKYSFFLSCTAQSHLTQEFICTLILVDMPKGSDISGA